MEAKRRIDEPLALTVALPARNGAATIGGQLAALAAQDDPLPWELVVVDNGSTDGTADIVRSWCGTRPGWQVVTESLPGVNRARNRAVAVARGEALLFCDADDVVDAGWVRQMRGALARSDIVGGRLEVALLNGGLATRTPTVQCDELPEALGFRYSVGASLGVRRRVVEAVGGFDESFPTGFDDVEFCARAQRGGFTIGFAPEAVVHYRLRAGIRGLLVQQWRYGRGRQRFARTLRQSGATSIRSGDEWRDVLQRSRRLARGCPAVGQADLRRRWLASTAFTAGRCAELTGESVTRMLGPVPRVRRRR